MLVTVNIIELSCELADKRLLDEYPEYRENEDSLWKDPQATVLEYCEEAQDRFNEWYDYYYTIIENLTEECYE